MTVSRNNVSAVSRMQQKADFVDLTEKIPLYDCIYSHKEAFLQSIYKVCLQGYNIGGNSENDLIVNF